MPRSSLSHGTPPNIVSEHYDVPFPAPENLLSPDTSAAHRGAVMSFYYLCRLTSILGGILPLVYSLKSNDKEAWRTVRRTECALDEWEEELSEHHDKTRWDDAQGTNKPRTAGLWFCYLTVKLMLNRLAFRARLHHQMTNSTRKLMVDRLHCATRARRNPNSDNIGSPSSTTLP
jgi:hypothetical protein